MQQSNLTYTYLGACTPSDTTLINCRAIYIGGAGNIALSVSASATAVTIIAPPVGTIIPFSLNSGRVMSTNTTATNIVLLA